MSGAMANDKRYATREEIALIKQRHEELEPCKRKVFEGVVSIFPDLQLLLINTEIEGEKNTKKPLIERKITWGQYNQNILKSVEALRTEFQPIIQRIKNNVALEKQQQIAARQQVLDALSTLADIVLDIKFHTERGLHRSGVR